MKVSKKLREEVLALGKKLRKAGTFYSSVEREIEEEASDKVLKKLIVKYERIEYDSSHTWEIFADRVANTRYIGKEYMYVDGFFYRRKKEVK